MPVIENIDRIMNVDEIIKVMYAGNVLWEGTYTAKDSDFVKVDGYWVYRGSQLEIKIPSTIQGESITSYRNMFSGDSTYNATPVTRVVSDNPNVTNMSFMFRSSKATTLDLSNFDTSGVTDMYAMFQDSAATTLDLSSFDTSNVTEMNRMFQDSAARVGYARTQADANKFNSSSLKPPGLRFVVKP